ncbi:MAG: urease accessory UreF family protein [Pseudomonadota bacterium]
MAETDTLDPSLALKLSAWLSPNYPVGAFAYSHGIEGAVAMGWVSDAEDLKPWLSGVIEHGGGWTDAVLAAAAWRDPLDDAPAALAAALAPSRDRLAETRDQGTAFAAATTDAWGPEIAPAPYPVAYGRAARAHHAPLRPALALYLQAFAGNLCAAAQRLAPIGQTDAQSVLAALSPLCVEVASAAAERPLDGVGGSALLSDIAAMRRETLDVRLFRS